jgi:hypothetical protein
MVYSIAAEKGQKPNWTELEHTIRRNFGGLDDIDAVEIFRKHVTCGSDDKMQVHKALKILMTSRSQLQHNQPRIITVLYHSALVLWYQQFS